MCNKPIVVMKKFFRMVTALSLACGVLAFTGCNDYEEDINSINNRLDELTSGQLASMDEQIKSLDSAIDEAKGLISTLQGDVDALESAKTTLEGQVKTINESIETVKGNITTINGQISDLEKQLDAADGDIADINSKISALEKDLATQTSLLADLTETVSGLEGDIAALEALTAGLPELEQSVADIENNYLSKKDAADIYATIETVSGLQETVGKIEGRLETIEGLDLASRLADLEDDYKDIIETVIPSVKEDIEKAQAAADAAKTAADAAQVAADAAQADATTALGDIKVLKEALGVYAEKGKLEAKISELVAEDAAMSKKAEELGTLISDLEGDHAADIKELKEKIGDVQGTIAGALGDINSAIDEINNNFAKNVLAEIEKACEKDGVIDQAIAAAIKASTDAMTGEDGVITKIQNDITSLGNRLTDVEGTVEDLENRIQSIVYVPEFADGKATVYSYTINGTPVSDNVVLTATFQVSPASLAANVADQVENVFVNVVPVKTRAAAANTAFSGESLKLAPGAGDGYVDVEVTLPAAQYGDGLFAFSMYVASKEDVESVEGGEETVADLAGTYVSSEYVQTAVDVKKLDEAYVLYNEVIGKEYPVGTELVADVNDYERAWSYSAADPNDRYVSFYDDNTLSTAEDQSDKGSYTLHIKLGEEYYDLQTAADMFRATVEDITPGYSCEVAYNNKNNEWTPEIAEYFVEDPKEPYGMGIDMAKGNEMTAVVGSYAYAMNTFAFDKDSKYGEITVLENVGKYTVINEPITVTVPETINVDWTYDFALAHADDPSNPTEENKQPVVNEKVAYEVSNLGNITLEDILKLTPVAKVTLNGVELAADAAPVLAFSDVDAQSGTMTISVSGYSFSDEEENNYSFVYTYEVPDYDVTCTLTFNMKFGVKPGDRTVEYGALPREIKFMLPGGGEVDYIGKEDNLENGYEKAFGLLGNDIWFKDAEQFKASMNLNETTVFTTMRDDVALYENRENTPSTPVHTRLNIADSDEYAGGSYVRVSSSQITAKGNVFDFETVVTTWYGVKYTFTAQGVVADPEYALNYLDTHVNYDEEIPYVELGYNLVGDRSYALDQSHLGNYFKVEGIPSDFNGTLTVKFETVVPDDPAYGTAPAIDDLVVNNADGSIDKNYVFAWGDYNARDLHIKASLYASANAGEEVLVNTKELVIKVDGLVDRFVTKAEPNVIYRPNSGENVNIKLWEYVEAIANAEYGDGENFIPTHNSQGVPHETLVYVNQNAQMVVYGAELVFDEDIVVTSGSQKRPDLADADHYNATTGIYTYKAEDGKIVAPIEVTVYATLYYYLDYNGVVREGVEDADRGAIRIPVTLEIRDK